MQSDTVLFPTTWRKLTATWNPLHRMYVCRDGVMRYASEIRAMNASGRVVRCTGGPLDPEFEARKARRQARRAARLALAK